MNFDKKMFYLKLMPWLLLIIICTGCIGHYFLPAPTKKKVPVENLLGKWRYRGFYNNYIFLDLKENGSFTQKFKDPETEQDYIAQGYWELESPYIRFENFYVENTDRQSTSTYVLGNEKWYITEWSGEFRIFGGMDLDPDNWDVMARIYSATGNVNDGIPFDFGKLLKLVILAIIVIVTVVATVAVIALFFGISIFGIIGAAFASAAYVIITKLRGSKPKKHGRISVD